MSLSSDNGTNADGRDQFLLWAPDTLKHAQEWLLHLNTRIHVQTIHDVTNHDVLGPASQSCFACEHRPNLHFQPWPWKQPHSVGPSASITWRGEARTLGWDEKHFWLEGEIPSFLWSWCGRARLVCREAWPPPYQTPLGWTTSLSHNDP